MMHFTKTRKDILMVLALLMSTVLSWGQGVNVNLKNVTIQKAVTEIQKITGYSVIVKPDGLNLSKIISVQIDGDDIITSMQKIFAESGQDIDIMANGRQIIVSRKEEPRNDNLTGIVSDENKIPLAGAIVAAGKEVAMTDGSGRFSIPVKNASEIVVSFLGYRDAVIPINGRRVINIAMEVNSEDLDETVVIAYGVQKKVDLSGSVAFVDLSDNGEKRATTSLAASLQGVAPGLLVQQSSSKPGADSPSILIRGRGTLNSSSPLVLVDGIVGSMSDVDPNDVESMSVLKDAASSAIYGSRAANGVILITTKKGKEGVSKITYNGKLGWSTPVFPIDIVSNSVEYMETINKASLFSGAAAPYTEETINTWKANVGKNEIYCNTDWYSEIIHPTSYSQHNIQAIGGNKKINYLVSLGYQNNEGIMEATNYRKYSIRSNISAEVTRWLRLNCSIDGSVGKSNNSLDDTSTVMGALATCSPMTLPYSSEGLLGGEWVNGGNAQAGNIYANIAQTDARKTWYRANGRVGLEATIIPSLKVYANLAGMLNISHVNQMFYPEIYLWNLDKKVAMRDIGTTSNRLDETFGRSHRIVAESYFNWDILPNQKDHNLTLLGGYNQQYDYSHTGKASVLNILSKDTPVLSAASSTATVSGDTSDSAVISGFGRLNYNYKERYFFEANVRADASSRFAKGHRLGVFPSFSAAWRISEEPFFNSSSVNNLKLRASWGQLGNNAISDYATQLLYNRAVGVFNGKTVPGVSLGAIVNESLKWETTTVTNLGVDFAAYQNRLQVSIDAFNKLTDGILLKAVIPQIYGNLTAPYENAGIVRNRGFELEASWRGKIGSDFHYSISGNYSFVKNKVIKYQGEGVNTYSGQMILTEGQPIYEYYVREVDCIATQEKIDQMLADGYSFAPATPKPGEFIFKDQQKEGEEGYKVINDNDRVIKGHSTPTSFFGITLGADWKGIDFSALFSGVGGVSSYYLSTWYTNVLKNGSAINKKFLNAWSEDNPDSTIPAITTVDKGGVASVSNDYWLQDASYLKLRNLTLGYTFPKKWFGSLVSRARIYFTGENLLTFTKFEGLDPENASSSNYPNMARYVFGVSVTF